MKTIPVVLMTKNRTCCAVSVIRSLFENLSFTGYSPRYIVCDDQSVPGHLEAVLKVFGEHGVNPSVHVTTKGRWGLGASMNMGLDDAFSDPLADKCFRIEDDWLLKHKLDLGPWIDMMSPLGIGSLRLGMMFRNRHELVRFPGTDLYKVLSTPDRTFTFNNQVAVITRAIYRVVGKYPENVKPSVMERYGAARYREATANGRKPPYVAWPVSWETNTHYGEKMPFAHIGVSISGHTGLYRIPQRYIGYNDPKKDEALRKEALGK